MTPREDQNRRLLRARDAMDRDYASELDIPSLARVALMSPAHFSRQFTATFGETPHRYLQRRRIERAMTLLRDHDRSVTEVALAVGYDSLGTFSRTFRRVTGRTPSDFRDEAPIAAPGCVVTRWTRPSSFGEAPQPPRP
ncbi:helix-turn-helix transcriptional regulator [Janibacter sp. FSL W8-0316]|uniref:Transcriptional regulator n=1 Tax=Janibacter indicus TaxID=857417 RepID=A0A1L3MLN1_9MICO|nr:helix-turn-helix transcriptional regulator [Janibacter indicus]APH03236.1 transcriptional regulator [Janibacter indicus]